VGKPVIFGAQSGRPVAPDAWLWPRLALAGRVALVGVSVITCACNAGSVQLLEPAGTASSGFGTINVHVVVDSVDADAAQTLGWAQGVPEPTIRWTRVDLMRFRWQSATADSAGDVQLTVPPGQYWVTAERDLSGPATASLLHGSGEPRAFAGDAELQLAEGGSVSVTLPVRLDSEGSLVLSEVYTTDPFQYGQSTFYQSKYVEIYNNSDQVQYLDGVILGRPYLFSTDDSYYGHHSCAQTEPFRSGSYVWGLAFWRLPGAGHDYPLAPGKTAVLAVSAADHSQVLPDLPDLRNANFEFVPPGTADNPGVPNIAYLGPYTPPLWDNLFSTVFPPTGWFMARPLDLASLPRQTDTPPTLGTPYIGVPVEDVLDYAGVTWNPTDVSLDNRGDTPFCNPTEPAAVDHLIAYIIAPDNGDLMTSAQRRVLRVVDGRAVLMDTNTSPVDWVNIPRTPGGLPPGGSP
jgi:hypothetical protein